MFTLPILVLFFFQIRILETAYVACKRLGCAVILPRARLFLPDAVVRPVGQVTVTPKHTRKFLLTYQKVPLKKMEKSVENSPVMMEKPLDLTLEECQEAFAWLRWKLNKGNFDMIMTLADKGVWHICEQIFGYLNNENLKNCRKVSKLWDESLERIALIKCIEEFGDREVKGQYKKVSTIIPGWKKAAHKYGVQASIKDLEEVKDSLIKLASGKGKCRSHPVVEAAKNGDVKLIEFALRTSYDMNAKDVIGNTALHQACCYGRTETAQLIIQNSKEFGIDLNAKSNSGRTGLHDACYYRQTETAQLLIQSSKEFGIDLNAKDNNGRTALHFACINGKTETVQMILKNWKEFGIDIKAQNNQGQTALDLINHHQGGIWNQIKKMLEKEFSQIDVTEPVFCDQQWNFRVFCSPFLDFF